MANFLTLAGVVYFGICAFMFVAQRRFLYVPDPARPDPAAAGVPDMRVLSLPAADGVDLLAWYRPAADARMPVLVYFHGNAGHIGERGYKMRPFLDAGFGVLLLSYRGYGGNGGSPTEQGLYADARAALDFLRAEGVTPDRTVIYGESLGSGVAVQIATETPPAALILEAPFISLTAAAFNKAPYIPVHLLIRDRFDSLAKIGAVRSPLFIVHGGRDGTVPVSHGRRLLAAANEPKEALFVPAAGHADLYDFGVAGAVIDYLAKTLSLDPPADTAAGGVSGGSR